MILRNAFVSLNGVNLSDEVREVSVEDGRAEHDDTVMSHTAESVEAGMPQWTITVRLRQNYAAGKTNATVRPLVGTKVTVVVRPDAGPVSATNEQITGIGLLSKYTPIGGAVGQPQEPTLSFRNAGTALAYATA